MRLTHPERRVVTFYSYKGGVGRTMALANVAYRLANTHGMSVIAVDWDLEAPGLHRFFGVPRSVAEEGGGVLDYCIAWRDAVRVKTREPPPEVRNVAEPRSVGGFILPIEDEAHRPRFGSISLLFAGRMDAGYEDRLGGFHWPDFYKNESGGAAVEALREKLLEKADVVLIDSRTGLSDTAGICSMQLADGVVLVTAPNRQSIEGIDRVARSLAKATKLERVGRPKIRVWLAVGRISAVEETYLTEQWFERYKDWFETGLADGLWLKEDHMDGLRTHTIPQRARWAFDEVVLNEAAKGEPSDPLVMAYEKLTGVMLHWLRGMPSPILEIDDKPSPTPYTIETLEEEAARAEQRGDMLGLALTLTNLAEASRAAGDVNHAIRKLEQARGILLSRGARPEQAIVLITLGAFLYGAKRLKDAEVVWQQAREMSRELEVKSTEALSLTGLALIRRSQGARKEAIRLMEEGIALNPDYRRSGMFTFLGELHRDEGNSQRALDLFREALNIARNLSDREREKAATTSLLSLVTAGLHVPDAAVLRARLAELEAAGPTEPPPS